MRLAVLAAILIAVALPADCASPTAHEAPLLTVEETQKLKTLLSLGCRQLKPDLECEREALALADKIAKAKAPPTK
ncbi:MAG TPA: hypothetical protein VMI56_17040 [Reyranella sp.]|nr:hypothetical protein [Reyranella sp.]